MKQQKQKMIPTSLEGNPHRAFFSVALVHARKLVKKRVWLQENLKVSKEKRKKIFADLRIENNRLEGRKQSSTMRT